jgi:hypothetical protein
LIPRHIIYHSDSECQSLQQPSSYTYSTDALVNSDVDINCENVDGTSFTRCIPSNSILTDGQLGPAQFNESESSSYYHWDKTTTNQILFTFPEGVSICKLQLHFYSDRDRGIALPKTRISPVDETFTVSNTLSEFSITIDLIIGGEGSNFRDNVTRTLMGNVTTSQILLRIEEDKDYALALSEIKFCTGNYFMRFQTLLCMSASISCVPYKILIQG